LIGIERKAGDVRRISGRVLILPVLASLAIGAAAETAQARVGGGFSPHQRRVPQCEEGLVKSGCYCHPTSGHRQLCHAGQYCHSFAGGCLQ
jgi:hypothetical protein